MFTNLAKTALRALMRQKLFAFINIFGLAIGLAACLILILYIRLEMSYDNFLPDSERIYRIENSANIPGRPSFEGATYVGQTYDLLPGDYSEIEQVIRLWNRPGAVIKDGERFDEGFIYTDPEFFDVLQLPFVEGTPEGALDDIQSVVISREMAIKHLGDGPWLGQTIRVNDVYEREMTVTGVFEDLPPNTHLVVDMLMPFDPQVYSANNINGVTILEYWNAPPFFVYVKLYEGASIDNMKATINDWVDKYFPEQLAGILNMKGSELWTPRIVALQDIHMKSPAIGDMKPHGSMTIIFAYGGIAGLILLIACINFVNLSMARSTLRAREIAIRKVVGASRKSLFWQFELESQFFGFLGLLLAFGITEAILPAFSDYTGRELTSAMIFELDTLLWIIGLTIMISFLAGAHPATVLSGVQPSRILRSNKSMAGGTAIVRNVLTMLQFSISAALIIMTCLIYIQVDYEQNRDLGYDRSNKMVFRGLFGPQLNEGRDTVLQEAKKIPGVQSASLSSFAPGDGPGIALSLLKPGDTDRQLISMRAVSEEFFPQFDVQLLAGRLFDNDIGGDRFEFPQTPDPEATYNRNMIINLSGIKRLGYNTPEEALGEIVYGGQTNQTNYTIVGVMPDIHFATPRQEVGPEMYLSATNQQGNLIVETRPEDSQRVGDDIEQMIAGMYPGLRIFRQFIDENIAQQYNQERVQNTLLGIFSGLAILVACMGLFGLAAFSMARRTKEIGIRKVMGASSTSIINLLLVQFARPILIANLIAWPVAWYGATQWLENFQYRIELLPWFSAIIVVAAIVTLIIGSATVLAHAVKVSRANPIRALRYE